MKKWEFLWRKWNNLRNKREKYQFSQFAHQRDFSRPPSSTDYRITPRILAIDISFHRPHRESNLSSSDNWTDALVRAAIPAALPEMVRNRYYVSNILQTLKNDQNDLKWTKKSNFDLKNVQNNLWTWKKDEKDLLWRDRDLNPGLRRGRPVSFILSHCHLGYWKAQNWWIYT